MKLIAGLGNPGEKYKSTRHNAGFLTIDILQKKLNFPAFKKISKFNAEISEGTFDNEKYLLVKPLTYMNLAGITVKKIMDFYKISPQDLFLIYDDVDLQFEKIRIRKKGSAGTHKGCQSIILSIGTTNFPRVRIGIKESATGKNLSKFVLTQLSQNQLKEFKKICNMACEALILALKNIDIAMNKFNK